MGLKETEDLIRIVQSLSHNSNDIANSINNNLKHTLIFQTTKYGII
jgi:hypothetical protein